MSALGQHSYWCHICRAAISPTAEFQCPTCNSDFIEEIEEADHPTNFVPTFTPPQQPQQQQIPPQPFVNNVNFTNLNTQPLNPFNLFQQMFGQMQAGQTGQANMAFPQVTMQFQQIFPGQGGQPGPMGPGMPLGGMLQQLFSNMGNMEMDFGDFSNGDYVGGQRFNDILNQLFQNAGHKGPPPASSDAIQSIPTVSITEEDVNNNADCAICQDTYVVNDTVSKLPCGHAFHPDCIKRWLEERGTCPVCRFTIGGENKDNKNGNNNNNNQGSNTNTNGTNENAADSAAHFYI